MYRENGKNKEPRVFRGRIPALIVFFFAAWGFSACTDRKDNPQYSVRKYFDYSHRLNHILSDSQKRRAIEKKDVSVLTADERRMLADFPRIFVSETAYTVLVSAAMWYDISPDYRIVSMKINDDKAKVTVEAKVRYALDGGEFKVQRTVFDLRRKNGKWLIADIGGVYHRFLKRMVDAGLESFGEQTSP